MWSRSGTPPENITDFEDVLHLVGGYGKYQRRLLWLFIFPAAFITAFLNVDLIFFMSSPSHWCYEPTVYSEEHLSPDEKKALVSPPNTDPHDESPSDSCRMYDLDYGDVLGNLNRSGMNVSFYVAAHSTNWSTVPCKYGWNYNNSLFKRTATTDWNLVCDRDTFPTLALTMSSAGVAIGTLIYGRLCDRYGRKPISFTVVLVAVFSSVLTLVFPWFYVFLAIQVFRGSLYPSLHQIPFLIALEVVSPDSRAQANGVCSFGWIMGLAAVPLVAWLTADWIILGWISAGLTIPLLIWYWFLPESPSWLMSQGRLDEASDLLHRIARTNRKDVSILDITGVIKICFAKEEQASLESQVSALELFKHRTLFKRLVFITLGWSAMDISYCSFYYNLDGLYGNEFLSFFLLTLAEAPSYILALFMMESRLGRRWSNAFFLVLTGIVCILPAVASKDTKTLTTVASTVGTFGTSAIGMIIVQQATEIFPTTLRASGLTISETLAHLIGICTPYIVYLKIYGNHIPYIVMSGICLIAGIFATFLPETLNENLPQDLEDGERFGKDKKFFSLAKKKLTDEIFPLS